MKLPTRAGVYYTKINYHGDAHIWWYQYFDGKRFLGHSSSDVRGAWDSRGNIGSHSKVVEWRPLNAIEQKGLPAEARSVAGNRRRLLA